MFEDESSHIFSPMIWGENFSATYVIGASIDVLCNFEVI